MQNSHIMKTIETWVVAGKYNENRKVFYDFYVYDNIQGALKNGRKIRRNDLIELIKSGQTVIFGEYSFEERIYKSKGILILFPCDKKYYLHAIPNIVGFDCIPGLLKNLP